MEVFFFSLSLLRSGYFSTSYPTKKKNKSIRLWEKKRLTPVKGSYY